MCFRDGKAVAVITDPRGAFALPIAAPHRRISSPR
jgi:hypothetical protein